MMRFLIVNYFAMAFPGWTAGMSRAGTVAETLDINTYPLTFAMLHDVDGDPEGVDKCLSTASSRGESMDSLDRFWLAEFTRAIQTVRDLDASGEDQDPTFRTKRTQEDTLALLRDVQNADTPNWPGWQRTAAVRRLFARILSADGIQLDGQLPTQVRDKCREIGMGTEGIEELNVKRQLAVNANRMGLWS